MFFFFLFLMRNIHKDDRSFQKYTREIEREKSREETEYMTKVVTPQTTFLNTSKGDIDLWFMYQCPSSLLFFFFPFHFN